MYPTRKRSSIEYRPITLRMASDYRIALIAAINLLVIVGAALSMLLPVWFPWAWLSVGVVGAIVAFIFVVLDKWCRGKMLGALSLTLALGACFRLLPSWYFVAVVAIPSAAACAFVCGKKMLALYRAGASDKNIGLFREWARLGQSLKKFPVGDMERRMFAGWAEMMLTSLAWDVTRAITQREAVAAERRRAYECLHNLRTNELLGDPSDIVDHRERIREAQAKIAEAERKYRKADKRVEILSDGYYDAWDFCTKSEPRGIRIFPWGSSTTPDAFRRAAGSGPVPVGPAPAA